MGNHVITIKNDMTTEPKTQTVNTGDTVRFNNPTANGVLNFKVTQGGGDWNSIFPGNPPVTLPKGHSETYTVDQNASGGFDFTVERKDGDGVGHGASGRIQL